MKEIDCFLFVDMELTPSFKVNVLKEWRDINGFFHVFIDWIICKFNSHSSSIPMERSRISSTIFFIYLRINCHCHDTIHFKQRLDV